MKKKYTYKKRFNKKKLGGNNVKQCDNTKIKCNDYVLNAHGFYIQELEFITIPEGFNIITYGPFDQASCFVNNINNFLCKNEHIQEKTVPVPNVYKTFPANSIIPNLIFHSDLKRFKKLDDNYIVNNQFFKSYFSKCNGDIILNIDNMMDNIFDRCINIYQNTKVNDCLSFIDNDFQLNTNKNWMDILFQYYKNNLINYKNITNLPDLFFNGYISLYTIFNIINKYKLFIQSKSTENINIHLLTCLSIQPQHLLDKIYLQKTQLNKKNELIMFNDNQNREFYFNISNEKLLLIYPKKNEQTIDKNYTDKIFFINDFFAKLINGDENFIENNYKNYEPFIKTECETFINNFTITKENNLTKFTICPNITTFEKKTNNIEINTIDNVFNDDNIIIVNVLGMLFNDNIRKLTNFSKIIYYFFYNNCLNEKSKPKEAWT